MQGAVDVKMAGASGHKRWWKKELSRTQKLMCMLALTGSYFFVELIVGVATGSLALVADSFHMASDVLAISIALFSLRLSKKTCTPRYSYGFHRAEQLGALANAVFLLGLCFTIFVDAIVRITSPETIENPKQVFIVGVIGLIVNFLGLVLFSGAGHAHAGGSCSHGHSHSCQKPGPAINEKAVSDAHHQDHAHGHDDLADHHCGHDHSTPEDHIHEPHIDFAHLQTPTPKPRHDYGDALKRIYTDQEDSNRTRSLDCLGLDHSLRAHAVDAHDRMCPLPPPSDDVTCSAMTDSVLDMSEVPSPRKSHAEKPDHHVVDMREDEEDDWEMARKKCGHGGHHHHDHDHAHGHCHLHDHDHDHEHEHNHDDEDGHEYNKHASVNMRAVLLHIMGDALGSLVVIVTALSIWLGNSDFANKYLDPIASLIITMLLVFASVPLVLQTCSVLLNATPHSVDLPKLRTDVEGTAGVVSVEDLHVWQLSETKLVASAHIHMDECTSFMTVAEKITQHFHAAGIDSVTLQPECIAPNSSASSSTDDITSTPSSPSCPPSPPVPASVEDSPSSLCLSRCGPRSCDELSCCPVSSAGADCAGSLRDGAVRT